MEKQIHKPKIGIGAKNWTIIWVAGLAGQLCWNIENQWFNTFLYEKIIPDPDIIFWMVAISAVVTTLSTFINGTWSDRLGKRRQFIAIGYIMWGLTTILFGTTEFLPRGNYMLIATSVVFADAIMSFFGSLGNDAGFNPWTTDITTPSNRGGLGAAIAVQPVIATILGTVVSGIIIQQLDYFGFFIIMGLMIAGVGVFSFFMVKESPTLKPNIDPKGFWHQFKMAFNFKIFKNHPLLFWTLIIFAAFFISFNVYFPHILNYLIYSLHYSTGDAGLIMGVGLIIAIPATIIASKFINRGQFPLVLTIAVLTNIAGLFVITIPHIVGLIAGITLVGAGYMCVYQALMIWVKNLYPENQRAQLEGVRLFFYVCIPMVIGPAIGSLVVKAFGFPMVNEYGEAGFSASNALFFVAAGMALLTFIPIYIAAKIQKRTIQPQVSQESINQ